MIGFIEFPDDEIMLALDDVVAIRALDGNDFDPKTGAPMRPMPETALTRIDTRSSGWHYVNEDYTSIRRRLGAAAQALGDPT